ncbi:hypothetical protein D3C72_1839420 [compost metagenome]
MLELARRGFVFAIQAGNQGRVAHGIVVGQIGVGIAEHDELANELGSGQANNVEDRGEPHLLHGRREIAPTFLGRAVRSDERVHQRVVFEGHFNGSPAR